eukprot:6485810-Amphidinium_carterae.1
MRLSRHQRHISPQQIGPPLSFDIGRFGWRRHSIYHKGAGRASTPLACVCPPPMCAPALQGAHTYFVHTLRPRHHCCPFALRTGSFTFVVSALFVVERIIVSDDSKLAKIGRSIGSANWFLQQRSKISVSHRLEDY